MGKSTGSVVMDFPAISLLNSLGINPLVVFTCLITHIDSGLLHHMNQQEVVLIRY